jgi:uncharacterized RDD family membrane protein YckC
MRVGHDWGVEMSDASPEARAGGPAPAGAGPSGARPWPRFFARQIDYVLFGMVFGTVHAMVLTEFLDLPWLALSPLMTFAWIPPEAILLSLFGTTPGKWAFSLRVVRNDGDNLSLRDALVRSLRVWIQGMVLGLPVVLLIGNWVGYQQLTNLGITAWDEATPSATQQAPLVMARVLTGVAMIAVCLSLVAWSLGSAP